jgi:inorganic pyrophosphatase
VNKIVDVEDWGDVNEVRNIIKEWTKRFEEIENKPERLHCIK